MADLLVYLRTQKFGQHLSRDDRQRIRHQAPRYLLIGDILYRRGIDTILRRCLTIDEADRVLNDCHSGACGGHLSGIATAQKIIRAGYFWPTLFHDCIHAMRRCEQCQLYANKSHTPPALLHPATYIMAVPGPLFIPGPWGALFSHHGQVRMRIVTFI
jgi:hypothetical protein